MSRVNTNKKHKDFGRVIPGARKDLYLKGILNNENFFELSKDEKINKVTIKSILENWTPKDLREYGYSAFGAYYLKELKKYINTEPDPSEMNLGETAEEKKELAAYLYTVVVNLIKEHFFNKNSPIINKQDVINGFKEIEKKISSDDNKHIDIEKNYLGKKLIEAYPHLEQEFKDKNIDAIKLSSAAMSVVGKNFFIRFLFKQYDKYNPLNMSIPSSKAETYGWSKLIKERTKLNLKINEEDDIIENVCDLIEGIRIPFPKIGLTSVDFKYKIEQEYISDTKRQGESWRKGKDIDANKVKSDIGFNGIQWGKWINGTNERQTLLNLSYDSLFDLAKSLNIDVKNISLNESLAIAYGSQGKAGSKAHYNPTFNFIHLNKMNGAGSLAHEWFHAYDNFLYKGAVKEGLIPEKIQLTLKRPFFTEVVDMMIKENNKEVKDNLMKFNSDIYSFVESVVTSRYVNKNISEKLNSSKSFYDIDSYIRSNLGLLENSVKGIKTTSKNLNLLIYIINEDNLKYSRKLLSRYNDMKIFEHELSLILPKDGELFKEISSLDKSVKNIDQRVDFLLTKNKEIEFEIKKALTKIYKELIDKKELNKKILNYSNKNKHFLNNFKDTVHKELINLNMYKKIKEIGNENKDKDLSTILNVMKSDIETISIKLSKNDDSNKLLFMNDKDNSEKTYFDKYIENKIKETISINSRFIKAGLKSFAREIISEQIAIELVNNGLDLKYSKDVKDVSDYYKSAKRLDSFVNKKDIYYSLPCEMFARAGASLISDKLVNTYLVAGSEEDRNIGLAYTYINPRKGERIEFNKMIEAGIKQSFKKDFNLELIKDCDIVSEEYKDIEVSTKKNDTKDKEEEIKENKNINSSEINNKKEIEKEENNDSIEKVASKKIGKQQQMSFKF